MITIVRSIEQNVFVIDITMDKLEEGDYLQNVRLFGEDAIEIGGDILDENGDVIARISSRRIRISELAENPIKQRFTPAAFGAIARDVALAWYEQTKERITDYIATKTTLFDDFSSETTIHI